MVASCAPAQSLFERVCEELGVLLAVKSADMIRYEDERSARVVGSWAESGVPSFPVGERIPVDGETVTAKLHRSGRPERVDDYACVEGELAAKLRRFGIRSAIGAPIHVAGRLWGAVMATRELPRAFPAGTEERISSFAELITAALANADAREQLAASRARIVEAATLHAGASSATPRRSPAATRIAGAQPATSRVEPRAGLRSLARARGRA
jgi:GAF domain-containing protein